MTQRNPPPFDPLRWPAEDVANPYPIYRHYRENDPVHRAGTSPDGRARWFVFRHDDVTRVLSHPRYGHHATRLLASIPPECESLWRLIGNWLVFMDPPRHGQLRSLIAGSFSARVVAGMRSRMAEIARDLIADIGQRPTLDLMDDFAAPLPVLVISELLGVHQGSLNWLRERAVSLQEASSGRARDYRRAENAAAELTDFFRWEARRRRYDPDDDVITALVKAGECGSLTEDEITATCVHLLTAGHETTTNLIGKSVLALLRNPGVLDELRADPKVLKSTVDELIRYDCPVQMVTRSACRDDVLRGRDIREGDTVVLVLGSANRDPLVFSEPDEVRPRGRSIRHCGFGGGVHHCLGSALARAEAEIAIAVLFECLPGLRLTDKPVQFAEDMVFHGPRHLVLGTCGGSNDA
ncbi:cytochrome P450 [Kutzneria sp. 744]|uniref:cytochrome P450 n=1 Tax=Kutzneria sp. (strain 744) TaxID=345341 RepID=UPI0003EEC938|nr:cytochrome P450 [Kutzneria sp. 744]EWM13700.1 cytochrome P450 107B1 [Kutzneria sp. 744]